MSIKSQMERTRKAEVTRHHEEKISRLEAENVVLKKALEQEAVFAERRKMENEIIMTRDCAERDALREQIGEVRKERDYAISKLVRLENKHEPPWPTPDDLWTPEEMLAEIRASLTKKASEE
ncbi:MAG: hypothetical protein U9Q07_03955 [Planctomycetota bacterium]|nr:hypothetical protein [Planctomycetota bacterium]